MEKQIYESRAKDFKNPFKKNTFRNKAEMEQVLGKPEDSVLFGFLKKEIERFIQMIDRVNARISK